MSITARCAGNVGGGMTMTYRNVWNREPTPKGLLDRICGALDTEPYFLAKTLGVPARDVSELLGLTANQLADIDRSEVLTRLAAHIDSRIGTLLAVRDEMQAKMNEDIKRRAARRSQR